MRPLNVAQGEVLGALSSLPAALVALGDALGLVPASPVVAPHPVPPFTNSAMDGYAVRAHDVAGSPVDLIVLEDVPAGRVATQRVAEGTAIKIMTGAPLPEGADAVVRVEDTSQSGDIVTIKVGVGSGTSVRAAGGDVEAGTEVIGTGIRLTPAHIGVLANLGFAQLPVHRRPRIALASTGDELVPVDGPALGPGQIRDSNRPMLAAMLIELGVQVIDLGRIPDDAAALRSALARGVDEADVIVTSGGVSMGEYDLVKQVLGELGNIEFWQVAMQPAKPFAFGHVGGKPLFGLPGNPVSSFVAFEQFVRPGILKMMGARSLFRPRVPGRTRVTLATDPTKTVFVRVRTAHEGEVRWSEPSGGQSSNVLSAVVAGDAFAVVPEGVGEVEAGGSVMLEMFRWPEERTFDER
ncbi:MAG TPA: gephyrin-like molybdotransferase Glp [Acidimicrobiia bacterium]|nr:gephyrin-like molybdotransferase Glp [Acidimicrobiia bacterium]